MELREVLQELESLGTAQNRKIYARHGARPEMYGVSYGNLNKLKKKIKRDQDLAEGLWASGNHDAMILACMVADPDTIRSSTLDAWAKDLDSYVLSDALSGLVARSPFAPAKMRKWIRSRDEWIAATGWNVVASMAMADEVPASEFADLVPDIEARIHSAKNRVRYSMNNALIAIGTRSAGLRTKAVAAAKRVGPVEVDHGETGCKTPDAVTYIPKAYAHRHRKAG